MYDQSYAKVQQPTNQNVYSETPRMTVTKELIDDMTSINNQSFEYVLLIQEKLHSLKDKRNPSDKAAVATPQPTDFYGAMIEQVIRARWIKNILEDLYNHISEIV